MSVFKPLTHAHADYAFPRPFNRSLGKSKASAPTCSPRLSVARHDVTNYHRHIQIEDTQPVSDSHLEPGRRRLVVRVDVAESRLELELIFGGVIGRCLRRCVR